MSREQNTSPREVLARRMWIFHNTGKPFEMEVWGDDADCFLEDLADAGYAIIPATETDRLRAEVNRWKRQSDDWQKLGWKLGRETDVYRAALARLAPNEFEEIAKKANAEYAA